MSWKDLKIDHIDYIEKCVGEFEITALDFFETVYEGDTIHYGSFKVKIYESQNTLHNTDENDKFTGFTNLRLKDPLGLGGYEGGVGFGITIEQALENTIRNLIGNIKDYKVEKKKGLCIEDFVLLSYDEY
ncbi:hypothetical protein ACH0B6_08535 [Solibacillus silvestris]